MGGGPAGAVLAYILAREGVDVTLLEKHADFDRDFRGDTLHPATMEVMDQLGLAERLLQLRHSALGRLQMNADDTTLEISFRDLKTKFPCITFMPQVEFLDFLTEEAKQFPCFHLLMNADVKEMVEENGKVVGVRYQSPDGWHEIRAALTVAANLLPKPLRDGTLTVADLARVQQEREGPTKLIQRVQNALQDRIVAGALHRDKQFKLPFLIRLGIVRRFAARLIAFGPKRVRLQIKD